MHITLAPRTWGNCPNLFGINLPFIALEATLIPSSRCQWTPVWQVGIKLPRTHFIFNKILHMCNLSANVFLYMSNLSMLIWWCTDKFLEYTHGITTWKLFPHYWPSVRGIHPPPTYCIHKGPVMRRFDISFTVGLNMLLNKLSMSRWFLTSWPPCGVIVMKNVVQTIISLLPILSHVLLMQLWACYACLNDIGPFFIKQAGKIIDDWEISIDK